MNNMKNNESERLEVKASVDDNVFKRALGHFRMQTGNDNLDNDFTRKHQKEFIYCWKNNKSILDFDCWTYYEELLNETITFEEYYHLDVNRDYDIHEVTVSDNDEISDLKQELFVIRRNAK